MKPKVCRTAVFDGCRFGLIRRDFIGTDCHLFNDAKKMRKSDFGELKQAVCQIVAAVPRGRATSYGAVARALSRRGWARLVGRMLANCGDARIPAHRVVNSQGRLSGSHAFGSPSRMRELLESEGVQVAGDRIVGWRKIFWDPCEEIEMP